MKKAPLRPIDKKLKPITGLMADESNRRREAWLRVGCNGFESSHPMSKPMSFWTEQDVLQYIKRNDLKYASVYGDLEEIDHRGNRCLPGCGVALRFSGCQRTGCVFCGYGAHLERQGGGESRFVRLRRAHPKLYAYCMDGGEYNQGVWQPNNKGLGMAHVIDELNRLYSTKLKNGRLKLFIEY